MGELRGKGRVLIVEDEMMVAMLIEDVLTDHGYEVAGAASTVDQALSFVSTLQFDAAILDLNLNGRDTYAVAEALQAKPRPFIFSTGYGAGGVRAPFQHVPVVQKPFQDVDLARAVDLALVQR
jgi:CheY-like chemotaxis protein